MPQVDGEFKRARVQGLARNEFVEGAENRPKCRNCVIARDIATSQGFPESIADF